MLEHRPKENMEEKNFCYLVKNHTPEENEATFLKYWKKNIINTEFHTQQKSF